MSFRAGHCHVDIGWPWPHIKIEVLHGSHVAWQEQ